MTRNIFHWLLLIVMGIAAASAQDGGERVFRKAKTEVSLKGLGKMTVEQAEMVTTTMKRSASDTKFKGEGFFKNMVSSLFFKSGSSDQIVDVNKKTITDIDHGKKQYRQLPIQQYDFSSAADQGSNGTSTETETGSEAERDSDIRIIRQVFTVNETGRSDKKNKFECDEFLAIYVIEWEVIESGERGKDSIRTTIWSTENSEKLAQANQIDREFTSSYLSAVGIEAEALAEEVLGLKWAQAFAQATRGKATYSTPDGDAMQELAKIKGMPIIIEGGYYAKRPKSMTGEMEAREDDDNANVSKPSKMLGRFAKKKLFGRKKQDDKEGALISWKNEVKQVKIEKTKDGDFQVPTGYDQVN